MLQRRQIAGDSSVSRHRVSRSSRHDALCRAMSSLVAGSHIGPPHGCDKGRVTREGQGSVPYWFLGVAFGRQGCLKAGDVTRRL